MGRKLVTMIVVAVVALVAVVGGAFVLSFDAITAVSEAAHIAPGLSWLMPVSVDGAMTVGTMAALVLKMLGRKTGYAWFVVLTGVAISVACNALHATQSVGSTIRLDPWQAGAVSAIPAVALALSLHLLITLIEAISDRSGLRPGETRPVADRSPAAPEPVARPVARPVAGIDTQPIPAVPGPVAGPVAEPVARPVVPGPVAEPVARPVVEPVAPEPVVPAEPVAPVVPKAPAKAPAKASGGSISNRDRARLLLAENPGLNGAELGRELGLSVDRGRALKRQVESEGTISEAPTATRLRAVNGS